MANILLIDDDPALLDVLTLAFEDAGHTVNAQSDGAMGLAAFEREVPDVLVSDVNMPRIDGFTLCKRIRSVDPHLPIILLTSRDAEIDEALGLELGADDYITKPFSTRVLLARIAALLRRQSLRHRPESTPVVQSIGALELDAERLEVRYAGNELVVTVTEFRMLELLCTRPGIVWSRDALLERIRGDETTVASRLIDTYVRRLRRKFEGIEPGFDRIETVIGAGYRWKTDT